MWWCRRAAPRLLFGLDRVQPMAAATEIPVSEHLSKIPATVRPTVKAARQLVKTVAPKAKEISYRSEPPRSSRAMWKIARYAVDRANVVGIGTFPNHATLWFYADVSWTTRAGCWRAA